MTPILNAALQGYSVSQIIGFLTKLYPSMGSKIRKAQTAGYGIDKILEFVSKTMEGGKADPRLTQSEIHASNMERQSQMTKDLLKTAAGTGAGILGASALSQLMPQSPQNPSTAPQPGPLPIQPTPNHMPPIGPNMGRNVPQPPQPQAPTVPPPAMAPNAAPAPQPQPIASNPIPQAAGILDSLGVRELAEKMRLQGKSPEMISQVIAKSLKGEKLDQFNQLVNSKQIPPLKDLVSQFMQEEPTMQTAKLPEGKEFKMGGLLEPIQPNEIIKEDYQVPEGERPPIKKGSMVIKPDGTVGEVKGEDKSGAIVESDGKASKVSMDELESEPEDVISITQDLLKIPEVDRSSVVSLFTYDPEEKDMFIQYHNGDTYRYLDVDPKKVFNVANKMGIPITEGKNIFGAWSPEDKKSIGATLIQEFLKDPKYAKPKKGAPSNPNYKKLETFYDYWEKLRKKPKRRP